MYLIQNVLLNLLNRQQKTNTKPPILIKKLQITPLTAEQEAVVRSIYNEEIKNIELLKELYTDITGSNFDNADTEFNIELDFGNMSEIFKTMCKAEIESAGFSEIWQRLQKICPIIFPKHFLL